MPIGVLPGGVPVEFGDALIAIDAVMLTVFFAVIYYEEIAAACSRWLHRLSAHEVAARFKLCLSAHKAAE